MDISSIVSGQNSEELYKWFHNSVQKIEEETTEGHQKAGNELDEVKGTLYCDVLINRIRDVEGTIAACRNFVPAHDLGVYRNNLSRLLARVDDLRGIVAPRKKFRFTRSAPAKSGLDQVAAELNAFRAKVEDEARIVAEGARDVITLCGFTGKELRLTGLKNKRVVIAPGELQGKDLTFQDLEDCEIVVLDAVGAVRLSRLSRCSIVFAAVCSSALCYFLKQCRVVIGSRQLRVHDTTDVAFHVCTRSSPVIERSRRIAILPYRLAGITLNDNAAHLTALWEASTLEAFTPARALDRTQPWTDVKDFDWIKAEASPHWRIPANADTATPAQTYIVTTTADNTVKVVQALADGQQTTIADRALVADLSKLGELAASTSDGSAILEAFSSALGPFEWSEAAFPEVESEAVWGAYLADRQKLIEQQQKEKTSFADIKKAQEEHRKANQPKVLTIEETRRRALQQVMNMADTVAADQDGEQDLAKKAPLHTPPQPTPAAAAAAAARATQAAPAPAAAPIPAPAAAPVVAPKQPTATPAAPAPVAAPSAPVVEEWPDEF